MRAHLNLVVAIVLLALAGCAVTVPAPAPPPTMTLPMVTPTPTPTPSPITDRGARDGAEGTVVLDGAGFIVGYLVVEGDVSSAIASRFGLSSLGQIVNAQGQKVGDSITIHAGEQLTLVPHD